MDAWGRGKADEARLYREQAYQLDPPFAVVANNLAWMIGEAGPEHLPRAPRLANTAVERAQPLFTLLRSKIGLDQTTIAVTSTAPCRPEVHEFWAALGLPLYEV